MHMTEADTVHPCLLLSKACLLLNLFVPTVPSTAYRFVLICKFFHMLEWLASAATLLTPVQLKT